MRRILFISLRGLSDEDDDAIGKLPFLHYELIPRNLSVYCLQITRDTLDSRRVSRLTYNMIGLHVTTLSEWIVCA